VEIVTAFGENVLVSEREAVVAVTVLEAFAVPAEPVHEIEYVSAPAAVAVTLWLPLVWSEPLHAPLAVHDVAFVDFHVSVTGCPTNALVDAGDSVTVGGPGGAVGAPEDSPLPPQPAIAK
jgi:hypothetical protein